MEPLHNNFENHLYFFANEEGCLTYESLTKSMIEIKLESDWKCSVIAIAVLLRFRDISESIHKYSLLGLYNWKIPVSHVIEAKHPASTNLWNAKGEFDSLQFEMILNYMEDGVLKPEGVQDLLDACAIRDKNILRKNKIICPFNKTEIKDGRDFGNTSWSFLETIMNRYGGMNEENLHQFFTDATPVYESLKKQNEKKSIEKSSTVSESLFY